MRSDKWNSVAAATLMTLIAMWRFVCSAALGVTGEGF